MNENDTLSLERREDDHMLLCGPCNGHPELGLCIRDRRGTCRICGEPCKAGRTEHRGCAIAKWRVSA